MKVEIVKVKIVHNARKDAVPITPLIGRMYDATYDEHLNLYFVNEPCEPFGGLIGLAPEEVEVIRTTRKEP